MKRHNLLLILLVCIILFTIVDPVLAGPGGAIAKGLFKSWWGKALLLGLTIILLPVIVYVKFRESIAVRKNKKLLLQLGQNNPDFRWLHLEKSVKNVFQRVWKAWSEEDMEKVSNYVSNWYWQNQQLVILDQWKENNLQNISNLRHVDKIKPLYLEITEEDRYEGSKIAFSILAEVEDYLKNRSSGEIVEGKSGYGTEEYIWILQYQSGNWILDDIRNGDLSLSFAKLPNNIPSSVKQRAHT